MNWQQTQGNWKQVTGKATDAWFTTKPRHA
jgi:hypothetical protein